MILLAHRRFFEKMRFTVMVMMITILDATISRFFFVWMLYDDTHNSAQSLFWFRSSIISFSCDYYSVILGLLVAFFYLRNRLMVICCFSGLGGVSRVGSSKKKLEHWRRCSQKERSSLFASRDHCSARLVLAAVFSSLGNGLMATTRFPVFRST